MTKLYMSSEVSRDTDHTMIFMSEGNTTSQKKKKKETFILYSNVNVESYLQFPPEHDLTLR